MLNIFNIGNSKFYALVKHPHLKGKPRQLIQIHVLGKQFLAHLDMVLHGMGIRACERWSKILTWTIFYYLAFEQRVWNFAYTLLYARHPGSSTQFVLVRPLRGVGYHFVLNHLILKNVLARAKTASEKLFLHW